MRKVLLLFGPIALLGACSWGIELNDAAKQVHTAWNGDVSGCHYMAKIIVSVTDRIGPFDRDDIKVRDELEVSARNQAAEMHADTIKPLAEPSHGSQPWGVYQCGSRARDGLPHQAAPASAGGSPASNGSAQTFPVKGG